LNVCLIVYAMTFWVLGVCDYGSRGEHGSSC